MELICACLLIAQNICCFRLVVCNFSAELLLFGAFHSFPFGIFIYFLYSFVVGFAIVFVVTKAFTIFTHEHAPSGNPG